MPETPADSQSLTPNFEDVQHHYDLSDDFYRLFLDPTQTYSCAYFERDDMTLEEAQIAKIDLTVGKLGLQPDMTLLDIGCGWGATLMRAIEKYDVNVVGLTLSKNQQAHVQKLFNNSPSTRSKRVLLQGWEQFDEPVDRIVSIGAFEHFGFDRYDPFFKMAYHVLPADGAMLLHTIIQPGAEEFEERGMPITMRHLRFFKFIMDRDLSGWQAALGRGGRGVREEGRLQHHPRAAAAIALPAHPRALGSRASVPQGRGHRDPVRRGLRAVHEVPDRLRGVVPRRLHRRLPVHLREGLTAQVSFSGWPGLAET